MSRTIVLLLIGLIFGSCFQQKSMGGLQKQPDSIQQPQLKAGLKIKSGPTRGTRFTDSHGSDFFIVHLTNSITNDSTIPIQLKIDLPIEYRYPISNAHPKVKIVLWPELTEPPGLYSDSQGMVMENFTGFDLEASNQFKKRLAPGEEYVVTIGTIADYPLPPQACSAVAYSFLEYSKRGSYSDCDWTVDEAHLANPQFALGLQVGFCTSGRHYESCKIITCGQIAYIEN